ICVIILMVTSWKNEKEQKENSVVAVTYPETKMADSASIYFGEKIKDPYRWLEDDMSDETAEWVKAQKVVTDNYLDNIPDRERLKERLTEIWKYERMSAPFREGDYTYYDKNDGRQTHSVVYRQKNDEANEEVFL